MLKCAVKRQAGLRAVRKTPLGKEIDAGARGPPAGRQQALGTHGKWAGHTFGQPHRCPHPSPRHYWHLGRGHPSLRSWVSESPAPDVQEVWPE